ncbi:MAG: asparagine synthase (glutamine-hydrolyzing) [Rhodospirillales bacterium]|nr:asparagine synthase (glutamine-hydrolyzing) [Rhodospirillales bacterium]
MCGLAGLFLPKGANTVAVDMDAMLRVMTHRGPDGEERHTSADRRYQVGFRRLAIIDLETGAQPIEDRESKLVLAGNGEIYNYRELRQTYQDYPWQTTGDMETVLPLVRDKGDAFVHDLNGMYALALYDATAHRLTLVRDRLGIKPLYWAELPGGGILFASEIKALYASGLIRPAINEPAVTAYLTHGWVPGPNTLFSGVKKLLPGHRMTVEADGRQTIDAYWRPQPAPDLPGGAAEIQDHLTSLLRDSLRLQLQSDVPVGALLSGGIDSGLMVALAAEQSSSPLNTFTVRFEGAQVDEGPLAAMVAERYGTNHTDVSVAAGDVARHLPTLAWHAEEPLFDAAMLPNFLINQVLSKHVTVALNGTGGDELFAGYGRYFQLPVEQRYLKLPGAIRRGLIEPLASTISSMTAWRLNRADLFDGNRGLYAHAHTTHFPPPMLKAIGHRRVASAAAQAVLFDDFQNAFNADSQTATLAADIGSYLPDDLLTLLDRTTMAVSVEGRVPFLDHRLVEAALAVPSDIRTPGGRQKGLQRSIAAKFLPEAILNAPKQGFASPVPAWMKAGLREPAGRILKRPETLDRGWWTPAGIDTLLSDPDRHGFRTYTLLMLELSVRLMVEMPAGASAPTDGLEAFADGA